MKALDTLEDYIKNLAEVGYLHFDHDQQVEVMELWDKLVESKKFDNLYLVSSYHWASEGYWIEHGKKDLSELDSCIKRYETKTRL